MSTTTLDLLLVSASVMRYNSSHLTPSKPNTFSASLAPQNHTEAKHEAGSMNSPPMAARNSPGTQVEVSAKQGALALINRRWPCVSVEKDFTSKDGKHILTKCIPSIQMQPTTLRHNTRHDKDGAACVHELRRTCPSYESKEHDNPEIDEAMLQINRSPCHREVAV